MSDNLFLWSFFFLILGFGVKKPKINGVLQIIPIFLSLHNLNNPLFHALKSNKLKFTRIPSKSYFLNSNKASSGERADNPKYLIFPFFFNVFNSFIVSSLTTLICGL